MPDLGEQNLRLLEASRRGGSSILETAHAEAIKAVTPDSFTVGGRFDGHTFTGGVTIDRKWSNGWGASAYLRAWYNDAPVVPTSKSGVIAGAEVTKKF